MNFRLNQKDKKNLIFIAMIELLFFLCVLFTCSIKYEVSDDFIMDLVFSGVYSNKYETHILFMNKLYGDILKVISIILPTINWYIVFQLVICLISFIVLFFYIYKSKTRNITIILFVVLNIFLAKDLIILPQFTKTSVFAIIVGMVVFDWAIMENNLLITIISFICLVFGVLIRKDCLYLALPFYIYYFIYDALKNKNNIEYIKNKTKSIVLIIITAIFVINLGKYLNYKDESYNSFYQWNKVRSDVIDYYKADYKEYEDDFKKINLSINDYGMIKRWMFSNDKIIDTNMMKDVLNIEKTYRVRMAETLTIDKIMNNIVSRGIIKYPITLLFIGLSLYCFFNAYDWYNSIILALIVFIMLIYFQFVGRNVYRVEFGIIACAIITSVKIMRERECTLNKVINMIIVGLLILGSFQQIFSYIPNKDGIEMNNLEYQDYIKDTFFKSSSYNVDKYNKYIYNEKLYYNFFEEARKNKSNYYLLDFTTTIQTIYYHFSPFDNLRDKFPNNLIYFGGVTSNHPILNQYCRRLGFDNWTTALLEDNVFFVSNESYKVLLQYFKEHGYPDVKVEEYAVIDGLSIWKYSRGK